MKVLVRSVGSKNEIHEDSMKLNDVESYPMFHREQFHMVDLTHKELNRDFLPPLVCCTGQDCVDIVALDEGVVYLIGGVDYHDRVTIIESLEPPHDKHHLFYKGCSKIKINLTGMMRWDNEVHHPIQNQIFPCTAPFLGKIYSFGFGPLRPEVYDPCVGEWKQLPLTDLPSQLVHCGGVSIPVLPDPSKSRILVYCKQGPSLPRPSLYAFYPASAKWEHLSSAVWWRPDASAALAKDVIYFPQLNLVYDNSRFPNLVDAFDLLTDKWLNIVWRDVHLLENFHFTRGSREFKLFCMKDGTFCFAESLCCTETCITESRRNGSKQPTIYLRFLNFTAERGPEGTNNLILTPLNKWTIILESTYNVQDLIPF